MVSVIAKDAEGKELKNVDGSFQHESVVERVRLEAWLANGHGGMEAEMFAYPCVCQPASGPFPERQHSLCVKFTPSPELAAMLHKEMTAAIAAAID